MGNTRSWEVSDEFWARVEPLIPARLEREQGRKYFRKPGAGRKAMEPRRIFEAIVFVLRTGCQWKSLPKERFGSASSVHKYFRMWMHDGFFLALWQAGLAEFDEMEGIAWRWQSVDGCTIKAPLARDSVGPNPTDRGKKWKQKASACRRAWGPAVDLRNRSQST
jgi:transposase